MIGTSVTKELRISLVLHAKSVRMRGISSPEILIFELNTEIYRVSLGIQCKYEKTRIKKNSEF